MTDLNIPKIPLDEWIDGAIDWTSTNFAPVTKAVSKVIEAVVEGLVEGLEWLPFWLLIIVLAGVAWRIAGRKVGIGSALGLLLLWNLGLWQSTLETMALVLFSTAVAMSVGLPLGILAALNETAYKIISPILDFMQTMPAFVYLIPAIPFFGLGVVSAIFSTVIFAVPPAIRLTGLGIRQVPNELIEAADAYGSTWSQKLIKLQLPLATPTIMAGVNQTIMLSLSMVVIAAMIGAGGLGGDVWKAIQRMQPGMGFEAGLGIVILAMILDRITQKIAKSGEQEGH